MIIKEANRPWIKNTGTHRHNNRNDRGFNYQSKQWTQTRNAFIAANPLCVQCGAKATVCDHFVRIKDSGDPYDWSNLRAMCAACHNKKDNNASKKRSH